MIYTHEKQVYIYIFMYIFMYDIYTYTRVNWNKIFTLKGSDPFDNYLYVYIKVITQSRRFLFPILFYFVCILNPSYLNKSLYI